MTAKQPLANVAKVLVAVAVFLIVPTAGVLVPFQFMGPWFVASEYAQPGFPPAELYQPAERLALAQQTARYIISPTGAQELREMRHGDEAVYDEREVQHLVDVMVVLHGMRRVLAVAGLIWLAALGVAIAGPAWRQPLAASIFQGSMALLAVLAGLLIASFLSFDSFFVRFHEVLFKADTWMFSYSDSLIQFFPVEFWMDFFWKLGASIAVEALAVAALALAYLKRPTAPEG
jgi:integral membrane protein (TIGR01906 family)